jgi:hypothetical protein
MRLSFGLLLFSAAVSVDALSAGTLVGFASLPAPTFLPGPTSGQFIGGGPFNGFTAPFVNQQPLQGVSGVLINGNGTYTILTDNGFGAKTNSADALLYFTTVTIDFKTASGGTGTVTPVSATFLTDPNSLAGFPTTYASTNYPNGSNDIPVPAVIANSKALTGFDFDPESIRRVADGSYWIGEEFGPFLIHVDANGQLLEAPIALPGVQAPQNPSLGSNTPNLGTSRGFEGMALSWDGSKLYPMLEGAVTGDPNVALRIYEFDLATKSYTGDFWRYQMDSATHAIGDLTAVNKFQFLVIERDNGQGATAAFKKVFLIDVRNIDANGYVQKTELVDLLNIADPDDLNGDGSTVFRFPFVTIEGVDIFDANTILITNDNNFPFSSGRAVGVADNNEFIKIRLNSPLQLVPEPGTFALAGAVLLALIAGRIGARKC